MVVTGDSESGLDIRRLCRAGDFIEPTSGRAAGYVQCNIVMMPADSAHYFRDFCEHNPRPCPLLAMSEAPGSVALAALGTDIDIRTDLPQYRIWRDGMLTERCDNVAHVWEDDWVAFALGCSFSFEEALISAGIAIRNIIEGVNVPMYRTNIPCTPAGPFAGNMVVSMRPMPAADAIEAIQICARFPSVHGAPIHIGDPGHLGIDDLSSPDFGDPVTLHSTDMPVFWACGVTPQVALEGAKLPMVITHEPGHMLVTDLKNTDLAISR
jgi:uncharacterized protein YcsI (UPF0317 family)